MNKYRSYSEDWLYSSSAYGEHVSAMTAEKLHSKSDIAAELAWRDEQLAKANERVAVLEQCVIKFRQGVTHFNRTKGDLNVLLSAYTDCEQLRKEQPQCK